HGDNKCFPHKTISGVNNHGVWNTRLHKRNTELSETIPLNFAFLPSDSKYKDGNHTLSYLVSDAAGNSNSSVVKVTLDNFQPYVENVSVHIEGGPQKILSNMNWYATNPSSSSEIKLVRPKEAGIQDITQVTGKLVVYAIFSEEMQPTTVTGELVNFQGEVQGQLIDASANKYMFKFNDVNIASQLTLDKCYGIRFKGKDMSGNNIIDFKLPAQSPVYCGWTNSNILRTVPKRTSATTWDKVVENGKDEVHSFRIHKCTGLIGEDEIEKRGMITSCDDFATNLTITTSPVSPMSDGNIKAILLQGSTDGYTIKWYDRAGTLVSSDWGFSPSKGGTYCYEIESDCAKTGEFCKFNDCVEVPCSGFEEVDPEFSEAIKFQLQEPSEKGKLVVVTTVSYKDFDPSQAIIQWFDNYGNLVTTADGFSPQLGPGRYCARIQWGCITGENCIDVGCDLRENLTIVEHTAKIEQNFNDNGLSSVSITFTNPEDNYGGDQIIWYNSSGEEIGQGLIIEGLTPGKYKYKISRGNCYGGEFEIEITGCESMARISDADYTIQQAGTDIWGYFLYLTFLDEEKYKNLTVKWFDGSGLIGEGNKIKVQLNSAVYPVFIYKDCFKPMPITVIDRCEQLKGAYAQTPIIFYQPMSGLSPNYTVGFRYTLHSISENFLIELFDENGQLLRSATIPAMWDVPPGRYTVKFYDNGCMFFSANIELLPCPDDPNWYNWMINDYHGILVNHYQSFNNQGSIKLKNIGAPAWSAGIEWYNGQGEKISTGNQITGLSPGVYCLKVKDDGPCLNLDRCFKIFNCGNFDAKITPTGSFSSTCKDGKLKIEVIYSSGLYSIDIKGPDGMITSLENEPKDPITGLYLNNVHIFDGLLPGIYDIEIKDIHCGSTYKYKEVVGTLPIGISRVTNIRTCRDNDQIGEGSISLNLGTEDTKDWEISWSGSGPFTYTNNGISNINTPGTYKVLIVNKQGCSLQFEQKIVCCLSFVTINGERTIVEPNIPPLNINLIPTHIDGIKDNFGRIFTEGAGPNLAFNWAGPDGYSSSNPSLTNLKAGVYCLTVTNGCDSYNTCIQVYDCRIDKININLIGLDACSERLGNEIKIYPFGILRTSPSGGVGAPYNIEWSNGSTQDYIDNLSPGDYCVTVSDRIGCRVDACFAVGSNQALFTDPNCNITCNTRFIREQSVVKSWWNPDHCNLLHYLCQGSDITHTYEYPDITISPPTNSMSCDITILCPNPARTLKYIIPGYEETICLSDKSNQNQSDFFNYYGCLVSYCDYPTLGKFMYKKILEEYDEINCTNVEEEGEPPSYYCLVSLYCDNGKISESPTALGSFEGAFEPTEIECAGNLKFNVLYEGRPPTKLGDNPDIFSLTISDNCDYLKCSLNNKVKSGNGKIAVFNSKNILLATYLVYLKEGFKEVLLPLDDLIGKDEVIKCELTLPNGRMISKTIENTCHLLRSKPIENVKRWNVSVYPNPSFSSLFCKLKIDIPAIINL
ncbi:MAG TPA: hypothetical protein PK209_11180, partial [Saprospiraceae bacterium]|nr:hypothetical protein [Saprospiraceae bacterium]